MTEFHRIRTFHDKPLSDAERRVIREVGIHERKRMIDDLHVPFEDFDQSLAFVRKRHRPVGMAGHDTGKFHLLVGAWRSGKSWPVIHYAQSENAARGTRELHPVVHVTCADGWGAKQVMTAIVSELTGAPPSLRHGLAVLTRLTINMIERFGVELLVIDELNEIMSKKNQASLLMSNLREILDTRTCNVLGVGEASIHKTIVDSYGYVGGRGGLMNHVVSSPDWHTKEGKEGYVMFLDDVDERLPFTRQSGLGIPKYASHFYDMSLGSIGYTMSYVAAAAYKALDEGADRIEHRHLVEMAVEARGPNGTFTHFSDDLSPKLVGRNRTKPAGAPQ